jgi:uncharacterized protein YjlB
MQTDTYQFEDDGEIPNNDLPLVVYKDALTSPSTAAFERRFINHNWRGTWVNGVFDYHHYHSTSHEVLGVASGQADVRFGGEEGKTLTISAGDVVVIPAGVGHCRESASADFRVVGAYPNGREWDLQRAGQADHAQMKANIADVPLPKSDPVQGDSGILFDYWT